MNKFTYLLALLLFVVTSCSTISEYSDAVISNVPVINYFSGCNYCTIKIKSSKTTNHGAPFYALVKATDFPTYMADNYVKISSEVAAPPEDLACFETFCIVPGKDQMITVETPDISSIGIYFLFTDPGSIWKQLIELEEGRPVIKIVLEDNKIASIET